jgi:hypothetical protein
MMWAGEEFAPLVAALGAWSQRWSRRQLADDEADLGLLGLEPGDGVRASAFGSDRTVVRLRFVDQPDGKDSWWFVNESGSASSASRIRASRSICTSRPRCA